MEKFVYPGWVAPIAITHPEVTLGFNVATVITAAGIVEFGLSFALFWTPLVRRLAALVLILLLSAATFDFGKVDAIGHSLVIIILLVVFADPGGKPEQSRPALAPLVSALALPAAIFLYTGAHAFYYGSKGAALVSLLSGVSFLTFIGLCLSAEVLLHAAVDRSRRLILAKASRARNEIRPRASNENAPGGRTSQWRTPLRSIIPAPAQHGAFAPSSGNPPRDRLAKRPNRIVGIRRQAVRAPTAISTRAPTGRLR
jgi:hypothetical protein